MHGNMPAMGEAMKKHALSGGLASIGLACLLFSIVYTAYSAQPRDSDLDRAATCKQHAADEQAKPNSKVKIEWGNASTQLNLHYVWPNDVSFNQTLCLIVSGVSSPNKQADPAQEAEPVPIYIFLNSIRADHMAVKAKPIATPQTLLVSLRSQEDASDNSAEFWRALLHSDSGFSVKSISVGISRSQTDTPEVVRESATKLLVFFKSVAVLGAIAIFLLLAGFILYARDSAIIRDSNSFWTKTDLEAQEIQAQALRDTAPAEETDEARKARIAAADADLARLEKSLVLFKGRDADYILPATFSLAKSQMVFWLILSVFGFIYIWLATGQYQNLITEGILVLLGISGATGLAAIQLTSEETAQRGSSGFWSDILSDESGPQLYRLQAVIWTIILGLIFIWHVIYNFRFVDFDTNLLILMGISHSLYLGFKARDKF
jgi:hypothetical protein